VAPSIRLKKPQHSERQKAKSHRVPTSYQSFAIRKFGVTLVGANPHGYVTVMLGGNSVASNALIRTSSQFTYHIGPSLETFRLFAQVLKVLPYCLFLNFWAAVYVGIRVCRLVRESSNLALEFANDS
jgi:hypothetical protein